MTALGQPLLDFQGSLNGLPLVGFCVNVFPSEICRLLGSRLLDETYDSVFGFTHIWITPEGGYSSYYINVSVVLPGCWPDAPFPLPVAPTPFPASHRRVATRTERFIYMHVLLLLRRNPRIPT